MGDMRESSPVARATQARELARMVRERTRPPTGQARPAGLERERGARQAQLQEWAERHGGLGPAVDGAAGDAD